MWERFREKFRLLMLSHMNAFKNVYYSLFLLLVIVFLCLPVSRIEHMLHIVIMPV